MKYKICSFKNALKMHFKDSIVWRNAVSETGNIEWSNKKEKKSFNSPEFSTRKLTISEPKTIPSKSPTQGLLVNDHETVGNSKRIR